MSSGIKYRINKKQLLISILVILCFVAVILLHKPSNDVTKIINNAMYKHYKLKTHVEVFETKEVLNYKIIAFTYDNNSGCGYAVMKSKSQSRYKMTYIKKSDYLVSRAEGIFHDLTYIWDDKTNQSIPYLVVLNFNDKLSSIKIKINSKEDVIENKSTPSFMLIKFPTGSWSGEYLFLDKSGNQIK